MNKKRTNKNKKNTRDNKRQLIDKPSTSPVHQVLIVPPEFFSDLPTVPYLPNYYHSEIESDTDNDTFDGKLLIGLIKIGKDYLKIWFL